MKTVNVHSHVFNKLTNNEYGVNFCGALIMCKTCLEVNLILFMAVQILKIETSNSQESFKNKFLETSFLIYSCRQQSVH